jgi:peroxiredoxin
VGGQRMTRDTALRALVAAVVGVAVVVGFWWLRSPETTKVKVGDPAPDLELRSLGATEKSRLSSFRGRPVLLVMFLSNCHLCDAEMPEIERLNRMLLPRGLLVVGVSADEDRAALQGFVQRHQVTFPVLEDPGGHALREAWGSWKLPEAYLIDASGKVAAVWLGSVNWSGDAVRDAILKVLPPRKPGSPW